MARTRITTIEQAFKDADYEVEYLPSSEEVPFDQLQILMGADEEGREILCFMQLIFQAPLEEDLLLPGDFFISFLIPLTFDYKQENLIDLCRMMMLINKTLEMPGFILSEAEKMISYRYGYKVNEKNVDYSEVVQIAELLLSKVDLFSSAIEPIANGESTLHEFLQNSIQ